MNLRRGAALLLASHGGRFPRSLAEALALPGVGRYTAAAVLSIAYGLPLAALDGNVRRVLSRLFARTGRATEHDLQALADWLLAVEAPGDWNQALMDLGATVCTPKSPSCRACPVVRHCRAAEMGRPDAFPVLRQRTSLVDTRVVAFVCARAGRILLARAMDGGPVSRLWQLPQTPLDWSGRGAPSAAVAARYGLRLSGLERLVQVRHAITNRRIRAEAWSGRLLGRVPADPDRFLWADPECLLSLPVSGITRKLARAVCRLPGRRPMG
jgi:A/G-specific adenine glycosylase